MINVYLTKPQMTKYNKGRAFQISAENMSKPGNTMIELEKKKMTVFNRNKRNGKGYRFQEGAYNTSSGSGLNDHGDCDSCDSDDDIEGGRFNLKRWARRKSRSVKKTANTVARKTQPARRVIAKQAKKHGRKLVEAGAKEILSQASDKAISLGFEGAKYGMNYAVPGSSDALDPLLDKAEKAAQKKARGGIKKLNGREFNGKGSSRPVKGSQEAKDKMSRLRAMRGKGIKPVDNIMKTAKKATKRSTISVEQLGGALNKEPKKGKRVDHALAGVGSETILGRSVTASGIKGYSASGIRGYGIKRFDGSGFIV